ncbi:hypothetical protein F4821DRAFT_244006 [Hypoxylon rubiginosum]|uniref:Uncharacterized protein n=1 Tax=Hypoxylon rubiginosum TaxID=110542 RepID=A0ACC0CU35_9PEZI|nr:hypothetical protein F4821DRAFT_244006 [Hypoxylon rubiginosum]
MACIKLTESFQHALLNSLSYPENAIFRSIDTYPKALTKAERLLNEKEYDLFEERSTQWEIPIRDLDAASVVDKSNIQSPVALRNWLGLRELESPSESQPIVITGTKRDPKCRFIYIYGMHSRSKLKLTRAMLTDILTFHQVMPSFLEFLYVFGQQSEPADLQFSGFREQVVLSNPPSDLIQPGLGRSGMHYQICYNLRGVALAEENRADFMDNVWSIRQAVFHHQFDVLNGNTLWIVIKGNLEIQQRFKALTDKNARPQDKSFATTEDCFRSSLSAHLMYCYWATEDWRWHIKWLERAVDKQHIMSVLGPSGTGYAHKTYTAQDIQDLQIWEEKTRQVITALEGNVDVMTALVMFYRRLVQDRNFPLRKKCFPDVATFAVEVGNILSDHKMQIKRAEFLVRTISDRRQLVIQHLQSQAASRAERLSRNMEQEQVFMLIITVMTLIYLPATFVSTFFSTDVIKYQGSDNPAGSYSSTAMARWSEVTLPLTVITCGVAWSARRCMLKKRREIEFGFKQRTTSVKLRKETFASSTTLLPLHNKSLL